MAKYLINKLQTHLSVAENQVFVPQGGWKELTEQEANHPTTVEAIRKKWAELVSKKPEDFTISEPVFKIEQSPTAGSLTFPKKKETA